MSEFQYVTFRAIDGPVSAKNLAFMAKQYSRAKVTEWAFTNEYHYGDFGGDAQEMLRRGYDIHLHYANFGIRTLMIRLPRGFADAQAAKPYCDTESITIHKDKSGPGIILEISPAHEPGDLDELWNLEEVMDQLLGVRAEILEGDLRPLYLAHLAASMDMEHDPETTLEGPVPAGLNKPTSSQRALAGLYGIGKAMLMAIARESDPLPEKTEASLENWLASQPVDRKNAWLLEWLSNPESRERLSVLTEFRSSQGIVWPTKPSKRSVQQLERLAQETQSDLESKAAATAARKRKQHLQTMASEPESFLQQTEVLVNNRSTENYVKTAEILADLREALSGSENASLPERHAVRLVKDNPTLKRLVGELRKRGFIRK
ncbi:hypothetical protein BH10PLA2_BH10PLA2_09630 [soil metagenome]